MTAPLRFLLPTGIPTTITEEVPAHIQDKIPSASATWTQWQSGFMLEQRIEYKHFRLFMLTFKVTKRIALSITAQNPFNAIQYTLKGNTIAYLKGYGYVPLTENTYTPVYVPAGIHGVWFEPGEYQYFYLLLTDEHLAALAADHPHLAELTDSLTSSSEKGMLVDRMCCDEEVRNAIARLYQIVPGKSNLYFEISELVIDLLKIYDRQIRLLATGSKNLPSDKLIGIIRHYILDNIERPELLDPEHLDHQFNIDKTVRRQFAKKYGIPIRSYIREQRMHRALLLLLSTSLSATQVASKLGYRDLYTFSRQFSSYFGFSPKNAARYFRPDIG